MFDSLDSWLDELDQTVDKWAGLAPRPSSGTPSKVDCDPSLTGIFRSLLGLDSWTFYVPFDGPWTGAQIEGLLKDHGIKMSGNDVAGDDLFFSVKLDQAEWAEYVLLRAGVPLKYGFYSDRNRRRFPKSIEGTSTSS